MTYLQRQLTVNEMVRKVAEHLKTMPKGERRLAYVREALDALNHKLPPRFAVCLSPRVECCRIRAQKCKVMDSKKLPLWLVFEVRGVVRTCHVRIWARLHHDEE